MDLKAKKITQQIKKLLKTWLIVYPPFLNFKARDWLTLSYVITFIQFWYNFYSSLSFSVQSLLSKTECMGVRCEQNIVV